MSFSSTSRHSECDLNYHEIFELYVITGSTVRKSQSTSFSCRGYLSSRTCMICGTFELLQLAILRTPCLKLPKNASTDGWIRVLPQLSAELRKKTGYWAPPCRSSSSNTLSPTTTPPASPPTRVDVSVKCRHLSISQKDNS